MSAGGLARAYVNGSPAETTMPQGSAMNDHSEQPGPPDLGGRAQMRFEATIHPGDAAEVDASRVADFDLDRVPDPGGEVRALLSLDDVYRLLEAGFEVRLQRALPRRPLNPELIADDREVQGWFEERARGVGRTGPG